MKHANDTFHTYTFDEEGNITAVDGGQTAQYVYNALNQRVRAIGGANWTLSAPDANNRLSNQTYDSAGEVTADQYNNSYSYDAEGRLLSAGGGAYVYDGAGNRVKKTAGGNVTLYWPGVPRQNSIRAKQRLDSESGGCFGSGIRQKPGTFRVRKSPRGRCQVVSDCSADAALPQFIFSLEEKSSR
jgi:hypothetical protein